MAVIVTPLQIGQALIGPGHPTWIVAEVGINHNGDIDTALKLCDVAKRSGCDAVKFQKRSPWLCVPPEKRSVLRQTPWGEMTELEYRSRLEFGQKDYMAIDAHCHHLGIPWFASCWDVEAVNFIEEFEPPCHKIPSACLTDDDLLYVIGQTGRPVILSTGMSTMAQIQRAVEQLDQNRLVVLHCTSTYPCPSEEINLRMIEELRCLYTYYRWPLGFSSHEIGSAATLAAVALGASIVERHITLRASMPGSDQRVSIEPWDLARLIADIRTVERALGDGCKRVYESEHPAIEKLRRNAECRT